MVGLMKCYKPNNRYSPRNSFESSKDFRKAVDNRPDFMQLPQFVQQLHDTLTADLDHPFGFTQPSSIHLNYATA